MQFLVVACNFLFTTLSTHTNTSSSSSKPILLGSSGTSTITDCCARYGYAYSTSYVAIVKASKIVPQESIADRTCENVVDVSFPQVVEQFFVVPKISCQTESCSAPWNRFLAVLVTLIVEQLVEVPKFVSQDRIQQRTLEQISDTPVPQVEELVGLRSLLPGCSTALCGGDFRNSRSFTH